MQRFRLTLCRPGAALIGAVLWLACAASVAAQQDAAPRSPPAAAGAAQGAADLVRRTQAENAEFRAENAELRGAIERLTQKLDRANGPMAETYRQLQEAHYRYEIELLEHRRDVFRWQLFASYTVLGIVALVTLAGLAFSAAQLLNALRLSQPQPNIDLEVSAGKLRITSSVVGVVVLTLSLAFVFLFLDRAYEIEELGQAPMAHSAGPEG